MKYLPIDRIAKITISFACAATLLTACGGGGGGDPGGQYDPAYQSVDSSEASLDEARKKPHPTSTSSTTTSTTPTTSTAPVAAYHLYVATTGSDSNPGTQSAPFRTIKKASEAAKPGTVVHVAPGTYTGGFQTTASGTATDRITYLSDVKWGARIVAGSASYGWDNRGNNVDIDGFEVDGQNNTAMRDGIYIGGSDNVVRNNHVHHIATTGSCSSNGGSAINTDHYYYGVRNHVVGNVVHHIGTASCPYIQGIYISTSGSVKNNLVYQVGAVGIHLWHDATDVDIVNNTVFSSTFGILVGSGDYYNRVAPADNVHVHNNIVFDNTYGISEQGSTGRNNTYVNNLVFRNPGYNFSLQNGNTHSGTISADPQFANYIATGGGDYRLRSSSPAVDKGTTAYAPSTDLNGVARPQGIAIDIGAYEFKN